LHGLLLKACDLLDSPILPELYVAPGDLNAFTAGIERPLIVINSGAIDALSPEEMLYVLGHEVGHIKSGHVLYYQIAEFLPVVGEIVGDATLGVGKIFTGGLQLALLSWKRNSEFTADRAGLLACQNAETALRALMKLSGLPSKCYAAINTEDFIDQARAFDAMDSDKLSLVAKWLSIMGATHPWTVMRAKQLLQWIDTGGYQHVINSTDRYQPAKATGPFRFCGDCGSPLQSDAAFCPRCGRCDRRR
jgi:Zn-dependent protease with chaperone function